MGWLETIEDKFPLLNLGERTPEAMAGRTQKALAWLQGEGIKARLGLTSEKVGADSLVKLARLELGADFYQKLAQFFPDAFSVDIIGGFMQQKASDWGTLNNQKVQSEFANLAIILDKIDQEGNPGYFPVASAMVAQLFERFQHHLKVCPSLAQSSNELHADIQTFKFYISLLTGNKTLGAYVLREVLLRFVQHDMPLPSVILPNSPTVEPKYCEVLVVKCIEAFTVDDVLPLSFNGRSILEEICCESGSAYLPSLIKQGLVDDLDGLDIRGSSLISLLLLAMDPETNPDFQLDYVGPLFLAISSLLDALKDRGVDIVTYVDRTLLIDMPVLFPGQKDPTPQKQALTALTIAYHMRLFKLMRYLIKEWGASPNQAYFKDVPLFLEACQQVTLVEPEGLPVALECVKVLLDQDTLRVNQFFSDPTVASTDALAYTRVYQALQQLAILSDEAILDPRNPYKRQLPLAILKKLNKKMSVDHFVELNQKQQDPNKRWQDVPMGIFALWMLLIDAPPIALEQQLKTDTSSPPPRWIMGIPDEHDGLYGDYQENLALEKLYKKNCVRYFIVAIVRRCITQLVDEDVTAKKARGILKPLLRELNKKNESAFWEAIRLLNRSQFFGQIGYEKTPLQQKIIAAIFGGEPVSKNPLLLLEERLMVMLGKALLDKKSDARSLMREISVDDISSDQQLEVAYINAVVSSVESGALKKDVFLVSEDSDVSDIQGTPVYYSVATDSGGAEKLGDTHLYEEIAPFSDGQVADEQVDERRGATKRSSVKVRSVKGRRGADPGGLASICCSKGVKSYHGWMSDTEQNVYVLPSSSPPRLSRLKGVPPITSAPTADREFTEHHRPGAASRNLVVVETNQTGTFQRLSSVSSTDLRGGYDAPPPPSSAGGVSGPFFRQAPAEPDHDKSTGEKTRKSAPRFSGPSETAV